MRHRPWHAAALGLALALSGSGGAAARAQVYGPPAPGVTDLAALIDEMQQRVLHLAEEIDADLGGTSDGRHLLRDTREVADAARAMRRTLDRNPDPDRVGRRYAEIDATWHHLREELGRRAVTPAIDRAARRVAQSDARLHRALGFAYDDRPIAYPAPAPAYDDRGRAVYREDRREFRYFDFGPPNPPPPPPGQGRRVARRPAFDPVAATVPLADQLVAQTDEFLQNFIPNSAKVPERRGFIEDTQALQGLAARLADEARRGAPPDALAPRVEGLVQVYGRLNQRLNRVAQGRPPGPNIVAILRFGETVELIEQQFSAPPPADTLPGPFPAYDPRFDGGAPR